MKKRILSFALVLLVAAVMVACDTPAATEPQATNAPSSATVETAATTVAPAEAPAEVPTVAATEVATEVATEAVDEAIPEEEEDIVYEGDAYSYYIDVAYAEQIGRYHTALSEKWDEGKYFDNEMSALPYYYYEGNPLDNVGFGFVDLDNDGYWELVIGAILNAEQDPAVFEIWTLVDGKPVMLAQGGSRNRYILQYVEEDNVWYVVNEGANGAYSHATYYLMLNEGKLEVMQGIIFDAMVDEKNPWFLTYDMDWDASSYEPIDEATANAILDVNRKHYTALEYIPYIFY